MLDAIYPQRQHLKGIRIDVCLFSWVWIQKNYMHLGSYDNSILLHAGLRRNPGATQSSSWRLFLKVLGVHWIECFYIKYVTVKCINIPCTACRANLTIIFWFWQSSKEVDIMILHSYLSNKNGKKYHCGNRCCVKFLRCDWFCNSGGWHQTNCSLP